ncbi:MAG: hypothetical protein HY985_17820 [Magnetospirillum sp.]|nr:hypothetical protein [Magnetospirillum sp.]
MLNIAQAGNTGNALGLSAARHRRPDPVAYPARWVARRFNVSPTVARLISEAHFAEARQ